MFQVHKFMGITQEQNDFFIEQVGAAALALGVTMEDVNTIASILDGVFNTRCPPPVEADDGLPSFLVGTNPSICQADSCPLAATSPCADPDNGEQEMPDTSGAVHANLLFGTGVALLAAAF